MTITHCSCHDDVVNHPLHLYFFKYLHLFLNSRSLPSNIFILCWILYFLLLFFYWGHSLRKCLIVSLWFPHAIFLHVGYQSFLDIKCPLVTLACAVFNTEPTQFDFILPTTVMGTSLLAFPMYKIVLLWLFLAYLLLVLLLYLLLYLIPVHA